MSSDLQTHGTRDAIAQSTEADSRDAASAEAGSADFVHWFRSAAPYINAHRGRTFVVQFSGEVVESPGFIDLIHDLVTLDALGVRLVLVHGARPQIDRFMRSAGKAPRFLGGRRVTDAGSVAEVRAAVGAVRLEVEARLSMGVINSPMHGAAIRVSSGNHVVARPLGVRDGVDFQYTGEVRRVDAEALKACGDSDQVALLSPLGYSPTGEVFNLTSEEVATAAAVALRASKLIMVSMASDGMAELPRELTLAGAHSLLSQLGIADGEPTPASARQLAAAVQACGAGVTRAHLLDGSVDGALLQELFTRDGVGTMVSADDYDQTRRARPDDVAGILALIAPLEADGVLVRRSRDKLESEIAHFTVMERDGAVIACAALYPYAQTRSMELACLVVDPAYRSGERGDALLARVEADAVHQGAGELFVLTTHTVGWFQERGFELADPASLPVQRQTLYNWQRNSRVLVKPLGR